MRSEGSERTSISGAKLVKFTNVRKETKITGGELTILKTCSELSVLRSITNFLSDVSSLRVKASHFSTVLSPSFIFTWKVVTNNAVEIYKNASYCCAGKYETWRQYPWIMREAFTCKDKFSDKILANYTLYLTAPLQYINNLETERSYKMTVNLWRI